MREASALLGAGQGDHVRQHHGERFVADELARAPDRVAETERGLLAGEARRAGFRQLFLEKRRTSGFLALFKRVLELVIDVEIILDDRLAAPRHEDEMLDPGLDRLVDDMLQNRCVDDGQHFLRHALGGRQKRVPSPATGNTALRIFCVIGWLGSCSGLAISAEIAD